MLRRRHPVEILPELRLSAVERALKEHPDHIIVKDLLPGPSSGMKMNPFFIQHSLKDEVAKKVIYTHSKKPEEVLEETSQWVDA
jgi:hypothetical protein